MTDMKTVDVYRIENVINPTRGLWYRTDGKFDPIITTIKGCKSASLPMDFDPDYADGKWLSACKKVEDLKGWFSHSDLVALNLLGFRLFCISVRVARPKDGHVVFRRTDQIFRHQLDMSCIHKRSVLE